MPPGAPAVSGPSSVGAADVAAAAPVVSPGSAPGVPPPGAATLVLRLPDAEEQATGPVSAGVKPGERLILLALIRNESGIVDNYDIAVRGLPAGWWTVTPATAYLVPYGTSGNYEQEVQVHVHPPRTPDAQARPWAYEVTAFSRAYQTEVAAAPATVNIEPYQDVVGKVAPDRAAGRLKARFVLTLRNRANAPAEVLLEAVDAEGECEFRFAQPSVTIDPGRGLEAPFTVFPAKQIWIGRPKDRPIRVTATPVGAPQPPPPMPATYRQRAWLPWWLSIAVPLVAAIVAAVILLMPKQTVVPNLKQAKNVFAAQTIATKAGLKLSPTVQMMTDPSAAPGSVINQTPAAGTKVKKGSLVSIEIAVGTGKVPVPLVVGVTPVVADTELRAAGLVLGAVSPQLNPNGKIATQIPRAQEQVAMGTPVAVFLQPAVSAKAAAAAGAAGAGAAGAAGAGAASASGTGTSGGGGAPAGGGATANAAGAKPVVIPAVKGSSMAAAQQLSQSGLLPTMGEVFSTKPTGTLVGTKPPAGTSVRVGTKVELLVSGGYPLLSFDNGKSISIAVNGNKKIVALPSAGVPQDEASWSADGTQIVFVQGPASAGQLVSLKANQQGAQPVPLTGPGANDHDPSFAPTTSQNLLAFIDDSGGGSKLCFAVVGPNQLNPACTSHPGWTLGRQVAWSPDGTKILVFATKDGTNRRVFGLIEFASNVAFSTQASLWGQGTVVTDTSTPGEGVSAGEFSPNGKRVALASNTGTLSFHLLITGPDLNLRNSTTFPIRACEVAWRPDGKELAVMSADSACSAPLGDIDVIDPSQPNTFTAITTQAANPAWQPLALGG
jgi:beta-lactam-binding protein with PASTA domain